MFPPPFHGRSGGKLKDPKASTIVSSRSGSSKRTHTLDETQNVSCLVDGCSLDLSGCKEYHRRHRVCEHHTKATKVIVGGEEQRFCQQCSRFHLLGEFDEAKRSCRKRLARHNKHRRPASGSFLSNYQVEFTPLKQSEKAETTEPSINLLEEDPLFFTPPNDEELVKAKNRLVLMQGGLGLTEPPMEEEWMKAEVIHLMDNELSDLPEKPMCPVLSALFLQGNYKLRKIPPSFFECMHAIQVLNLSKTGIKSLPESLFGLVGLKRLFLNNCHNFMRLSPKVGELKSLEVLDLEGTEIIDLPKEVEKLTNLTCLKVSFYGYINRGRKNEQSNAMIHGGVMSALSQLEELNINVNPDDERWGVSVEAVINEVCSLMHLNTLKFYFPSVEVMGRFLLQSSLLFWYPSLPLHFRFIVGRHFKRVISRLPHDVELQLEQWDRCLKYINGEGVPVEIMMVLQHATAFHLDRHMTVKKLSEFGIKNMEQLKCCILGECNEIQVIIDGEDVPESYVDKRIGLESLEYLNIYYMKNLRSIWEGPVRKKCLSLLKSLTLCTCPRLTTIFSLCLLDNLYSLEELTVEDCPAIKSLVSCENCSKHEASYLTRDYFLPKLKRISLYYLPELISISSDVCIALKLEWLSFYNCPNLKSLSIEEVSSTHLQKITGERDWWEALEWRNGRPDNLDGIFVPIKGDNFIKERDTHHSLFLSPSQALKHEWSPSQQQVMSIERGKDLVEGSSRLPSDQQQQTATPSRYESQKRRDWNTFGQYLKHRMPPVPLSQCTCSHAIEFLRYLDQFGKTKVHLQGCPFFGQPEPPAPCACPLRQAWGSLDALIGRLQVAYEENGGSPNTNPFASCALRTYLREVRESQSKARGIPYMKKKKAANQSKANDKSTSTLQFS